MPGVLLVHGGPERARRVFAEQARADWSQGLTVVLEKHGLLELETAPPSVLTDPARLARYGCVLIAELDPADWTRAVLGGLAASQAQVLVGAPPPRHALEAFGVVASGPGPSSIAVRIADGRLRRLAEAYGVAPGGRLGPPVVRRVDRTPLTDWERLAEVPVEPAQARAWNAACPAAERWTVARGTETLAVWSTPDEERPAIVRRGGLHACSFALFGHLARAHTSEPWSHGEFRSSGRSLGLEGMLLGLIDLLHERRPAGRARVRPWPGAAAWALTVRHDVDRAMGRRDAAGLLAAHARTGTAATWYWRARHLDGPGRRLRRARARRAVRLVARSASHEIAHHTEALWAGADAEQRVIEGVAGRDVVGTSAHGDPSCFRFQGAPNALWAERQGHLYTELIQQAHVHPHRFLALRPDGEIALSDVVCLPHHVSFDRSSRPGDHAAEEILELVPAYVAGSGLLQVMNHPDLNIDALFAMLAALPRDARWDCTARQAAAWWRETHSYDRARIERDAEGRPRLSGEGAWVSVATLDVSTP